MSRFERFATRDLTFSGWHRHALGHHCGMIDIDCLEYCARCKLNLFLMETARENGQVFKNTAQMEQLARSANIPAYCLIYTIGDSQCPPTGHLCRTPGCGHGITSARLRQVSPLKTPWKIITPAELTTFFNGFHQWHETMVCDPAIWRASSRTAA